jgi:hypothetical protein
MIANLSTYYRIDAVLKDWNDYLMDYPQFFSYIAAIISEFFFLLLFLLLLLLLLYLNTINYL